MTPLERFRQRLERRAALLSPELRAQVLRAFERIRASLVGPELTRLLESGRLDAILSGPLSEERIQQAFAQAQRTLRDGAEAAAAAFTKDIPGLPAGVAFNLLNAEIARAIRDLNLHLFGALSRTVQDGVRDYVEATLRTGRPPREIVANLRSVIGMAPNQVAAVQNFRRMLEEGDGEALTRALRDRRFDRTVVKALGGDGLTPAQVDRMVAAYERRMVAFHAETVARTAALSAQRMGQHLAWQGAMDRGDLDPGSVTKRWSGTLDTRERDSHLRLEGETVPFNQPFRNGLMFPGDLSGPPAEVFNCRCIAIYSRTGTAKPGAGAFGIDPEQLKGVNLRDRGAA